MQIGTKGWSACHHQGLSTKGPLWEGDYCVEKEGAQIMTKYKHKFKRMMLNSKKKLSLQKLTI